MSGSSLRALRHRELLSQPIHLLPRPNECRLRTAYRNGIRNGGHDLTLLHMLQRVYNTLRFATRWAEVGINQASRELLSQPIQLQGYLAHKKKPCPLGPPKYSPTAGS